MNISSTIASDYVRWRKFLHDNVHFLMKESEIHTEEHCARVLLFALLIAEEMKLPQDDREALGAASVFTIPAAWKTATIPVMATGPLRITGNTAKKEVLPTISAYSTS